MTLDLGCASPFFFFKLGARSQIELSDPCFMPQSIYQEMEMKFHVDFVQLGTWKLSIANLMALMVSTLILIINIKKSYYLKIGMQVSKTQISLIRTALGTEWGCHQIKAKSNWIQGRKGRQDDLLKRELLARLIVLTN